MGLLSAINKKIANVGNTRFAERIRSVVGVQRSNQIADITNKALTILTHPIKSISDFKSAQKATAKESASSLVAHGASNTLAVVAPFNTGVRSIATKAAIGLSKSFVQNPVKTTGTVAAGIVGANVLTSSQKARSAVINAPSSLANFGQNVGNTIQDPSIENFTKIGKDNPILTGSILAGAAAFGAKTLVGASNVIATEKNTNALEQLASPSLPQPQIVVLQPSNPIQSSPQENAPISAPSAPSKPKTKRKRKRKRKTTKRRKRKTIKRKATKRKTRKRKRKRKK